MTSSIEDVQQKLDKMMLAVFEAVRKHTIPAPEQGAAATSNEHPEEMSREILQCCEEAILAVRGLPGIDATEVEQRLRYEKAMTEMATVKERIRQNQEKLHGLAERIDASIEDVCK
jgi:hypothetical protein